MYSEPELVKPPPASKAAPPSSKRPVLVQLRSVVTDASSSSKNSPALSVNPIKALLLLGLAAIATRDWAPSSDRPLPAAILLMPPL